MTVAASTDTHADITSVAPTTDSLPRMPELLAEVREWLSSLTDVDGLTASERLQVVTAAEEIKSAVGAVQARATTGFMDQVEADARQARADGKITWGQARRRASAARSEVALARRCSPGQADRHVATARAWCSVLPATMAALTTGQVSEVKAGIVARETTCLSPVDRREADARLTPDLGRLGEKGLAGAAQRACIEIDPASVIKRHEEAVAAKRVSTRPAPDGMAWLSILGEMTDVVGAFASLKKAEAARWTATGDPELDARRAADERSRGAWMADTALERLSGRDEGQAQPVEVGLVMDQETLLPRDDSEHGGRGGGAAEIPGWGAIPPSRARAHLLALLEQLETSSDEQHRLAGMGIRRLFTSPDVEHLVAMDSKQRFFTGALRALIELRDATCRIPWCDAPTRQIDHAERAADGGTTSAVNGWGLCQRHNLDKEAPGWFATVTSTGLDPGGNPHEVHLTTPHGHEHACPAPPLLGLGRDGPMHRRRSRRPRPGRSPFEIHLESLTLPDVA